MADEHVPGSMDIRVQEKTFAGFVTVVSRTMIAIAIFFVLLAIFGG